MVLEWDPIDLATADLISLSLYRNGQKAGNIPRPLQMHSTKISGLAVDTEYTFHLVLRTTAGTFASKQVVVRTHKMTDLSGITITTGILPAHTREELTRAVERIGAKIVDGVRIDTTHFVTTEGRGVPWEKAVEMNIPVVRPEWVEHCESTGRILGVTRFYLDAQRPGPPGPNDTSSVASPSTPATTRQIQKDLPQTPAKNEGNKETEREEEEKRETKEESSEEENGTEAENEDKTRAAEEQKARREDKDTQEVAIRPGKPLKATIENVRDENSLDEKAAAPSPGDGASFQDVALWG